MVIAIINAGQESACKAYWVAEERRKKGPAHTRIQLDHYWRWREEKKKVELELLHFLQRHISASTTVY